MSKVIETTVYTFNELSNAAKENARAWYRDCIFQDTDWVDSLIEDAAQIGFKITSWDTNPFNVEGEFVEIAQEVAESILKNHGEHCETYVAAKFYRDGVLEIEPDSDGSFTRVQEEKLDALYADFKRKMEWAYQSMLAKEYDYVNSDEYVDEGIIANEYTFTKDGKRFG